MTLAPAYYTSAAAVVAAFESGAECPLFLKNTMKTMSADQITASAQAVATEMKKLFAHFSAPKKEGNPIELKFHVNNYGGDVEWTIYDSRHGHSSGATFEGCLAEDIEAGIPTNEKKSHLLMELAILKRRLEVYE